MVSGVPSDMKPGVRFRVRILHHLAFLLLAICLSAALMESHAIAGTKPSVTLGPSGLPLPRFVSLKSGRVNMRVGPGTQYAVEWMYLKPGLPMEIIQEYDNWRRVRDANGAEGWIHHALLSGTRTGVVAPWFQGRQTTFSLLAQPQKASREIAKVEPGVVGQVIACNGRWCRMQFSKYVGWIEQNAIWGVYPDEAIAE